MLGLFFDYIVDSFQIVTKQMSLFRDNHIQLHRVSKIDFRRFGNRFNAPMAQPQISPLATIG